MLTRTILIIVLLVVFPVAVFSAEDDSGKEWSFGYNAYARWEANRTTKGLGATDCVVTLKGNYGPKISAVLEMRCAPPTRMNKAFVDYKVISGLKLRAGQFSNPFKFLEPPPSLLPFAQNMLVFHYLANSDDLGVAVHGDWGPASYSVCLLNGADRNTPDNNQEKDYIGYLQLKPTGFLTVEGCYQQGQQPDGLRKGYYSLLRLTPHSRVLIEGVWVERFDLDDRGWQVFGTFAVKPTWWLTARSHQVTQDDKVAWTFGTQILIEDKLKVQPNIVFGESRRPNWSIALQLDI